MIIQHTVTCRRDEYTYFFCRNRQQGTCPALYVNVAIAEHAVERHHATIGQQQIVAALAALATSDYAPDRLLDPAQFYERCTDDQRRLLNHALFRRLYLADGRITNHEPRPATPL